MTDKEYAIQCIKDEAQAVLDLTSKIDDNFDKAVDLIMHCSGKVIVTGVGKSGHIGAKIAATLASTGTPSFFVNPLHVFMSGNSQSLLAKYSTCHLNVSVEKEACPLNLAPTSSTTAALVMGDALAIALMNKRHFQPQDFAQYHPGGELGKRLLTTAQDVMITENLPLLSAEMHLGEAIILVSKGKLGLGVAIENGCVVGIITDGDIRRAMERWKAEFFDRTVGDIMTRTPKTVTLQTKISEIQKIMNKNKIHNVLVTDETNKLLGIVDRYACILQ